MVNITDIMRSGIFFKMFIHTPPSLYREMNPFRYVFILFLILKIGLMY
jgi:hypothetical protein